MKAMELAVSQEGCWRKIAITLIDPVLVQNRHLCGPVLPRSGDYTHWAGARGRAASGLYGEGLLEAGRVQNNANDLSDVPSQHHFCAVIAQLLKSLRPQDAKVLPRLSLVRSGKTGPKLHRRAPGHSCTAPSRRAL
jgi:hypothetical protein